MNATGTALQGKHTVEARELYMAFELSEKNWKLSFGDGARSPSHYTVAAGDTAALLECIAKAKARCGLAPEASVGSCYEAGRDGFWLHRWLIAHGIDNIVVDSASIEVNRRARRAKTDRLDGDKLLAMLIRYGAGERRVWSVVRVPTPEQEAIRLWAAQPHCQHRCYAPNKPLCVHHLPRCAISGASSLTRAMVRRAEATKREPN